MKALIVDDSRATRAVLKRMVASLGYEVSEATDGMDALTTLQTSGSFDLMLLDWNMPIMNGLDLLKTLRQSAEFDNLRIIMVTTETEIGQMSLALENGANEYIMKPFTTEVVREKLAILGLAA